MDPGLDSTGLSHKVHICSVNNFPTAAGLASSAAGFACLGESVCILIKFHCSIVVVKINEVCYPETEQSFFLVKEE